MSNKVNIVVLFFLFILLLLPIVINANVLCGDGTTSDKCSVCGHGCCSHHGGCVGPIEDDQQNNPTEPVVPESEPTVIEPVVSEPINEAPTVNNETPTTKKAVKQEPVVTKETSTEVSNEVSEEEILTEEISSEELSKEEKISMEDKSSEEDDDSALFIGFTFLYIVLGTIASAFLIPFFIIKNIKNKKK